MKHEKIDAAEVWKELDAMAPRLGLSVIDRAVYLHLLRLTHVEGKRRLRFSILGIAPTWVSPPDRCERQCAD
jgi:hypothetical protein